MLSIIIDARETHIGYVIMLLQINNEQQERRLNNNNDDVPDQNITIEGSTAIRYVAISLK